MTLREAFVIGHLSFVIWKTAEKIGMGIAIAIEVIGLQKPIAIAIPMPMATLFMRLGARLAQGRLFRNLGGYRLEIPQAGEKALRRNVIRVLADSAINKAGTANTCYAHKVG